MSSAQIRVCLSLLLITPARCNQVLAQPVLDPEWPENPVAYGGPGGDAAGSVQQTSDGGYIVAGVTYYALGDRRYSAAAFVMKLDSRGRLDPAWVENPRTFAGPRYAALGSVQQTSDGGYIAVGMTGSSSASVPDALILKLDSQGILDGAWPENPKAFGKPEDSDAASCVWEASDGGYIVTGITHPDGILIKLDGRGMLDPAWSENPRRLPIEVACIQPTSDGGYIGVGSIRRRIDFADAAVVKLDQNWMLDATWPTNPKAIGGPDYDDASSVMETSDGGFIVAGQTRSFGAGSVDAYLLKLNRRGDLDPAWGTEWPSNPKTFGGPDYDLASSVQETANGGYLVSGYTKSFGSGGADVLLILVDGQGNLDPVWGTEWPRNPLTFGDRQGDLATSLEHTTDGGYIVAGQTNRLSTESGDVLLIKLLPPPATISFKRGDCSGKGRVCVGGVTNAVFLFRWLFAAGPEPLCVAACDANASGDPPDISDGVYILGYCFLGGAPPPAPFPDCGIDPSGDVLACSLYSGC